MDEKKIIRLNVKTENEKVSQDKQPKHVFGFLQTNPIIKEMLIANLFTKKKKFSLKDFFKL